MRPCSRGSEWKEEVLDVHYLEIEERIMLVISGGEEDEEDQAKKTEKSFMCSMNKKITKLPPYKSSFHDASWYKSCNLKGTEGRRGYYGSDEKGSYDVRVLGHRAFEVGGRRGRGTGVFIPKSTAYGSVSSVNSCYYY